MGKDGHMARWAQGRGHRLGETHTSSCSPHVSCTCPLRPHGPSSMTGPSSRGASESDVCSRRGCAPPLLAWDPLTPAPQFSRWPDPQTFSLSPLSLPVPIASFSSCKVSSHSVSYKGAVVLGMEGQRRRVELASPRAELRGCQPGHGALGICPCPQPRARWCWAWQWGALSF